MIGGGINGVAIARELALAGRRTLLLERNDFASGTTSRSTRIIHGGLRYLEHGELGLVRESLRERERLLNERGHLVRPMTFLLALHEEGERSALAVRAGLWLYRRLGNPRPPADTAREVAGLSSRLDHGKRWTVFDYEDAQCEFPERLVAEWLVEAIAAGAVVRNHCMVLAVRCRDGRARGITARDQLSGQEFHVSTRQLINATGPWADRVCESSGIRTRAPLIGGVRGSHIVLPKFAGAPSAAVYAEARDGRPIFVIPWNGQVLVGTTEVRSDADHAQPSASELDYLFTAFLELFPNSGLRWSDVRFAFAGVRPLPFAPGEKEAAITRRSILHDHAPDGAAGMISVIGGKLTTAAAVARDCARKLGVHRKEPAGAAVACAEEHGFEEALAGWAHQVSAAGGIAEASARSIALWHGRRALCVARSAAGEPLLCATLCPHTEHLVAEAVEAVRTEAAVTLADILLRRVPVALGACWSEECSRVAAERIGAALRWSDRRCGQELESFEEERAAFLQKPQTPQRAPLPSPSESLA